MGKSKVRELLLEAGPGPFSLLRERLTSAFDPCKS